MKNKLRKKWIMGIILIYILMYTFNITSVESFPADPDFESYYNADLVHFFGPGLQHEFDVPLESFRNGTYARNEAFDFYQINYMETVVEDEISGTYLWDVLNDTGILQPNATYLQFAGKDGYGYGSSYPMLPVRILEDEWDQIFVVTQIEGETPDKGPLKTAVNYSAIQNDPEMIAMYEGLFNDIEEMVHNSKFSAKWLAGIYVSDQPTGYEDALPTDTNTSSETMTTTSTTSSNTETTSTPSTEEPMIAGYNFMTFLVVSGLATYILLRRKYEN